MPNLKSILAKIIYLKIWHNYAQKSFIEFSPGPGFLTSILDFVLQRIGRTCKRKANLSFLPQKHCGGEEKQF